MRFPVRLGARFRIFVLTGFLLVLIKKPHKVTSSDLLTSMTASLTKKFPQSPQVYLDESLYLVIKERRNLLRAFISTSPIGRASQLRTRVHLFDIQSSRILTRFPFACLTVLPYCLGPTNSYMSATRKKTFPTTIFKALRTQRLLVNINLVFCSSFE